MTASDVSADVPPQPATAARPARPTATYRTDLVMILFGAWFTVGLLLDAWAHNNVPGLETFFTPWHAVFYTGFTATAAWILWTCRGALIAGRPAIDAIPVGYASALIAAVGFAIAGVGDFAWHTIFGIEQDIIILFSPTHLGLIVAMLVIVTAPLRSAWANRSLPVAPGLRRLLPAVLSVAFATTLVLLFLQYANVLTFDAGSVVFGLANIEQGQTATLVADMAVTNLVVLLPLLTLVRRWALPVGAATILYAAVGGLSVAVTGFHNVDMIIGFLIGGVCVDGLALVLRPAPERLTAFRAFGAIASLATWTIFIVTAYVTTPSLRLAPELGGGEVGAAVELYTGVPMVQALIGLLVAVLLVPQPSSRSAS